MQAYTSSVHHPLIESLAQSSPAATSTPNPIQQQQQQQSLLNQDLITNLFLKLDPASFLPAKKEQSIMHATNLASFNASDLPTNKASKRLLLGGNVSGQQQQQQFGKLAGQQGQQQK